MGHRTGAYSFVSPCKPILTVERPTAFEKQGGDIPMLIEFYLRGNPRRRRHRAQRTLNERKKGADEPWDSPVRRALTSKAGVYANQEIAESAVNTGSSRHLKRPGKQPSQCGHTMSGKTSILDSILA